MRQLQLASYRWKRSAFSKHSNHLDQYNNFKMLVSLTVGKVDAGVAVLLTEDKRLVSVLHPLPNRFLFSCLSLRAW